MSLIETASRQRVSQLKMNFDVSGQMVNLSKLTTRKFNRISQIVYSRCLHDRPAFLWGFQSFFKLKFIRNKTFQAKAFLRNHKTFFKALYLVFMRKTFQQQTNIPTETGLKIFRNILLVFAVCFGALFSAKENRKCPTFLVMKTNWNWNVMNQNFLY